jgi:predicted PurR-regulated permease PerM
LPSFTTRRTQIGWLVLVGLLALFVALGLLKFLVFLLFMRLAIDLLVEGLGGRLPYVSRKLVLYAVYLLLAAAIVLVAALVVPRFVAEFPAYADSLERNLTGKITDLLATWRISVDLDALKVRAVEWGQRHVGQSVSLARRAATNVVLLVVAFVITFVMTHDRLGSGRRAGPAPPPANLWDELAAFIDLKVATFYACFRQVMAGQVVISLVNTALTLGLLLALGIPHKIALTVLVFVFGLVPIVGNLVSNTAICFAALIWAGPWQVLAALLFLVFVHKLEYFLNSKIIGNIVHLPMYLTLLGLIVGEELFRVSGMILAVPVILFARLELSAVRLAPDQEEESART